MFPGKMILFLLISTTESNVPFRRIHVENELPVLVREYFDSKLDPRILIYLKLTEALNTVRDRPHYMIYYDRL